MLIRLFKIYLIRISAGQTNRRKHLKYLSSNYLPYMKVLKYDVILGTWFRYSKVPKYNIRWLQYMSLKKPLNFIKDVSDIKYAPIRIKAITK